MSSVFLAEQISPGRQVDIKLMATQIYVSPGAGERFVREARVAAAVNHLNDVRMFDVGQAEGRLYMVLELVTGGAVARLAEQHGGRLPEKSALRIAIQRRYLEGMQRGLAVHRFELTQPRHRSGFPYRKPMNLVVSRGFRQDRNPVVAALSA